VTDVGQFLGLLAAQLRRETAESLRK